MKNSYRNTVSSYIEYWYVNYLYRSAVSQKLHLGGFIWVKNRSSISWKFRKNNNEDSNIRHFFEGNFKFLKSDLNSLLFLSEIIKIGKTEELMSNFYDENKCCTHKNYQKYSETWIIIEINV